MYSELSNPIREVIRNELLATHTYDASFARTRNILKEIECLTGSRVISYFTSFKQSFGVLDDDAIYIEDALRSKHQNKPLVLILNSPGGQSVAAEKILTVCRAYKKSESTDFFALIPKSAKSAATIVALGADKILMSTAAELGPIDPQIVATNSVDVGKETTQENVGGTTKTVERKLFQPSINVIPAIRIIKAVEALLDDARSWFSWGSRKIDAQFLLQYGYDLYLMAKNELLLSENILEKIVQQKRANSTISKEFEKALEIFLVPDLTLSHNRPITLAELESSPLSKEGFICGYVEYFKSKGMGVSNLKKLDTLLWEYYVRTNAHIEDTGNPISKVIESSSHRFHLSPDGQMFLS